MTYILIFSVIILNCGSVVKSTCYTCRELESITHIQVWQFRTFFCNSSSRSIQFPLLASVQADLLLEEELKVLHLDLQAAEGDCSTA